MKIFWSPLAIDRINEIADYIAADNKSAARKWLEQIFLAVEQIELFPHSGRLLPELDRKNIREIIFGNYRIIYKIMEKELIILTIRHIKQNLSADDL